MDNNKKKENYNNSDETLKNDFLNSEIHYDENNESEVEFEEQIVELINDFGETERLVVEATFHLDDVEYAVLREENSDEGMIYSIERPENGKVFFNMIEDEEELKEVIEIYEGIADDLI